MKIMKKIVYLFLIPIISLIFGSLISNVFAQESVGIFISPVRFELTANPGDVIGNKIKVKNPTDSTISLRVTSEDFKAIGEEGHVAIDIQESESDKKVYSLKSWIKIQPNEFILNPGEERIIDFIIEIPENAEPGGKYGSVIPTITGLTGEEFTGATVSSSVAALVLLTISGDVKEDILVDSFVAPNFSEYGPVPFEIRFKNNGTVHVAPRGYITVVDWMGNKVDDVEFSQFNVIPGAVRKINKKLDKKWLLGKYTATLVGSYGTSNTPLIPYVTTFWVFPWKIFLSVFVVLLLFIIFFYITRKRWKMALKILLKGEHRAQN